MQVEECWVLVGHGRLGIWRARMLRYRSGQLASVEADATWVLKREETRGDIVGFLHTHPMGGLHPSRRDVRTMRAWCDAFGKPLLCMIATPQSVGGWLFNNHRSSGMSLAEVRIDGKTVTGK